MPDLRPHLRYLGYVARHKAFVAIAGLKTGAPIHRLLIHDWSKLTPAEWTPYVRSFYGSQPRSQEVSDAFDVAWLHHQHANAHHWQHWLLVEDDGPRIALVMPEALVREMVADWMGAGRAITGKWDVVTWYAKNRHKIVLHPKSRVLAETLLGVNYSEFDKCMMAPHEVVTSMTRCGLCGWTRDA